MCCHLPVLEVGVVVVVVVVVIVVVVLVVVVVVALDFIVTNVRLVCATLKAQRTAQQT